MCSTTPIGIPADSSFRPLLDMELEVPAVVAGAHPRVLYGLGLKPDATHRLRDGHPVAVDHAVEVLAGQQTDHGAAADAAGAEARLLTGKADHLDAAA